MNAVLKSFMIFIKQISRDGVLIMVLLAPVLMGFFFRFGIPAVEGLLTDHLKTEECIRPYYGIIDLMLASMSTYMYCFVVAMTMLDEYDSNIIHHLTVTPLRKNGYLFSRLYLPTGIGFLASLIIVNLFALTQWTLQKMIIICILTSIMAMSIALIIFSFSKNKVEGMAVAKISGLFLVGLAVPYFIDSNLQYLFVVFPAYWVAKVMIEPGHMFVTAALITSLAWFILLNKRFHQKLSR